MRCCGKKVTALLHFTLSIFLIILLYACGDAIHTSSETGSIAFSVEWRGAPTIRASQASIKAASLDCEAVGVTTVEGSVYDASNSYLASGGPWNCEDHQGTITGVPAGSKTERLSSLARTHLTMWFTEERLQV